MGLQVLVLECSNCDMWEEQPADMPRKHIQNFKHIDNDTYKCECGTVCQANYYEED